MSRAAKSLACDSDLLRRPRPTNHLRSDVCRTFQDQVGSALENPGTLSWNPVAPLLKPSLCHLKGQTELFSSSQRHLTDDFFRCGGSDGSSFMAVCVRE